MTSPLSATIRAADATLQAVCSAFALPLSVLLWHQATGRGHRRHQALDAALVLLAEAGLTHLEAAAALDLSGACHVSRARRRLATLLATSPSFRARFDRARALLSRSTHLSPPPRRHRLPHRPTDPLPDCHSGPGKFPFA